MKTLTLIRHAKSSWKKQVPDIDRPLNKRGQRNAPEMGARLAARGADPDGVVSSPAKRALATALTIVETIGFERKQVEVDERVYTFDAARLLEVVQTLDERHDHVMVFGHNPAITDLTNELANANIGNVPTCGVVVIQLEVDAWRFVAAGGGTLVEFDYPKNT